MVTPPPHELPTLVLYRKYRIKPAFPDIYIYIYIYIYIEIEDIIYTYVDMHINMLPCCMSAVFVLVLALVPRCVHLCSGPQRQVNLGSTTGGTGGKCQHCQLSVSCTMIQCLQCARPGHHRFDSSSGLIEGVHPPRCSKTLRKLSVLSSETVSAVGSGTCLLKCSHSDLLACQPLLKHTAV